MTDLYWSKEEDETRENLFVGCQPSEIAWMWRTAGKAKWWTGFIDLPWRTEYGLNQEMEIPNYLPREEMRAAIEKVVRRFFDLANTDRPAEDKIE